MRGPLTRSASLREADRPLPARGERCSRAGVAPPPATPPIAAAMASSAACALAPSGPPACAMSGLPPPPLPPSTSEALRTRSTAEKRAMRSARDADHDAALAVLAGARPARPRRSRVASCRRSARLLRSLISMPSTARAISLTSPTSRTSAAPSAAARRRRRRPSPASCARRRDRARASCARPSARRCAPACRRARCAVRPRPASRSAMRRWRLPRLAAGQRLDAAHAGGDRAFAGHRDQADIAGALHMGAAAQFDRPAERVAARSRAPLPIDTTRTSSPYFSPNSARAPASRASSTAISRVVTSSFSSTTSLAMSSTRRSSSAVIGFGCTKSKRSRSGATSEPLLRDVIAEHLAQRLVQQMRRGVIGADRDAARVIDFERQRGAELQRALLRPCRDARTDRRPSSACR